MFIFFGKDHYIKFCITTFSWQKNAEEGEYRIAGNFRGDKIFRGSAILRHFVGNIFVVAACTAGKGRQGRFIRG